MRTESTVPVVMLTARQDEPSIVEALDLGADDYITKPFSPRQLVARIRAVLRRASTYQQVLAGSDRELRCGDLVLDTHLRSITRGDTQLRLTPLEYRILHYLMINRGHVLASSAIVEQVWGYEGSGNEDLVKVHVHRLRQKLEPDPGGAGVPPHRPRCGVPLGSAGRRGIGSGARRRAPDPLAWLGRASNGVAPPSVLLTGGGTHPLTGLTPGPSPPCGEGESALTLTGQSRTTKTHRIVRLWPVTWPSPRGERGIGFPLSRG